MSNFITLEQAIQMTKTFRENRGKVLADSFQASNILPNSETFDRAAFDKVLAQPGCTAVRVYLGMSADLQVRTIIVGVNEKNEDILPSSTPATEGADTETGDTDVIVEDGTVCPPICPPTSPLNP